MNDNTLCELKEISNKKCSLKISVSIKFLIPDWFTTLTGICTIILIILKNFICGVIYENCVKWILELILHPAIFYAFCFDKIEVFVVIFVVYLFF